MCLKTNEHSPIYLLAIRSPRRVSCVGENHPQFGEQKGSFDSVRGVTRQSPRGAVMNRIYNTHTLYVLHGDCSTDRYPLQFGANALLIMLAASVGVRVGRRLSGCAELRETVPTDSDSPARLVVDRLH